MPAKTYNDLVIEAVDADFSGWDFSWVAGRSSQAEPSWDYDRRAAELVSDSDSLLDLGTGGGELLASLAPLPVRAVATEGWEPNISVAASRLGPLGCEVRRQEPGRGLPAADGEFDLVLSHHSGLPAAELRRVLRTTGTVFTQQVGARNDADLNEALGAPPASYRPDATLQQAVHALTAEGFEILDAREEFPAFSFFDVGALVYHLRAVSWQVPDFDIHRYDTALRRIDQHIRAEGSFTVTDHRYMIEARR
jgi:SAM-dependent methyltransferase